MIVPEPLVEEKKKKAIPVSQIQEPDPLVAQQDVVVPVEKTPKQLQGNYVEDFNDLDPALYASKTDEVVPIAETSAKETIPIESTAIEQPRTSQDIVNDMMNTSFPKPTYDPNRPEELKRLARSNAIAKGINLIGDTAGLALGANVNRRAPDGKEAKYVDDMFKYIDDYDKKEERWNYQNTANELRKNQLELNQLNTEETLKYRNRVLDDAMAQREITNDQSQQKITNADTRAKERNKIQSDYNKIREKYYSDLAKRSGTTAADKRKKGFVTILTEEGQEIVLSPSEAGLYRRKALNSIDDLKEMFPGLFDKKPILDARKKPTGEYDLELSSKTSDEDLIRAYMEMEIASQLNYNRVANVKGRMDKKLEGIQPGAVSTEADVTKKWNNVKRK